MQSNIRDNSVPREIHALLLDERVILRATQRAVTPFGGVAVFLCFPGKTGLVEKLRQHMPVVGKSPNHIESGRLADQDPLIGQHLELADSNSAEVGFRVGDLSPEGKPGGGSKPKRRSWISVQPRNSGQIHHSA